MNFYVERYKSNEFIEIYRVWHEKVKKSDLKIKKPKKPKNLTFQFFLGFKKSPKKPRFFKIGLDSPAYNSRFFRDISIDPLYVQKISCGTSVIHRRWTRLYSYGGMIIFIMFCEKESSDTTIIWETSPSAGKQKGYSQ